MKVILKENIDRLGSAGDIKNVSEGYARNYLLPKGLVLEATQPHMRKWENEKKALEKKKSAEIARAEEKAAKLKSADLTVTVKTGGENNKMFGSVTAAHIAESLTLQGHEIDKKDVLLAEPIKEVGTHVVKIRIIPQVEVSINVSIVGEQ